MLPGVDTSIVYLRASTPYCFHKLSAQITSKFYPGCWQRETYKGDSGRQMRADKERPLSGVISYSRVWRNGASKQGWDEVPKDGLSKAYAVSPCSTAQTIQTNFFYCLLK